MNLGWIRYSCTRAEPWSTQAIEAVVAHANHAALSQLWLPEFTLDRIGAIACPDMLRLGVDLCAHAHLPPRRLAALIRSGQQAYGEKFLVGMAMGRSRADRLVFDQIETLLSQDPCNILPSDFPMTQPRAEVLLHCAPKTDPDLRRGAQAGFNLLSPAWQDVSALARHWAAIVTGATHAKRRARTEHWHLARMIYVDDDPKAVAAYVDSLALPYLDDTCPNGRSDPTLVIAGSAEHVSARLADLRRRVGPFGTLQVLDPGLSPEETTVQMSRIAMQVLPSLRRIMQTSPTRELENT